MHNSLSLWNVPSAMENFTWWQILRSIWTWDRDFVLWQPQTLVLPSDIHLFCGLSWKVSHVYSSVESKLTWARVIIATIWQLGGCPCSQCLIPTNGLHCLGMARDRVQQRTLAWSNIARSQLVIAACRQIYDKHYGVDSTVVEALFKPELWVPTAVSMILTFSSLLLTLKQNVLSDRLSPFGFNVFASLVVDLLHEFELGVWRMLLIHLLRILTSLNKDLVHELDKRFVECIFDDNLSGYHST